MIGSPYSHGLELLVKATNNFKKTWTLLEGTLSAEAFSRPKGHREPTITKSFIHTVKNSSRSEGLSQTCHHSSSDRIVIIH